MNHINTIEIKNFKSIRHQKIDDCRRVNVFIGYPNVGKSNILEALGLLTFIRQKRPTGLKGLVRFERFTQLFNFLNIQEPAIINFNDEFFFTIQYEDEQYIKVQLSHDSEKNISIIPYTRGILAGKETLISGSTNNIDDFSGRFPQLNKFSVKPYIFSSQKKFNETYSAIELRVPAGDNMFEVIANNAEITKQFSDLLKPYNNSLTIDTSTNEVRISLKREGEVLYTLPTSMIADTLLRLIFFKTAIHSNKNSVLLFEEPESHMFPPYISKFTSDIVNDENNNQFFLATHSPFVLNDLISNLEKDELSVYIVSYENETGETVINRMSEENVDEAYQFGYDFFMNMSNFIPQKEHGQV